MHEHEHAGAGKVLTSLGNAEIAERIIVIFMHCKHAEYHAFNHDAEAVGLWTGKVSTDRIATGSRLQS